MKWSQAFIPTLREDPKDADAVSHKFLVRGGFIRRLGSGTYSYLPLGQRILQKTITIIREEMDAAGAQECLLPALHPPELWQQTGRAQVMGDILFRFRDRHGKENLLGPTHEEIITHTVAQELRSYKQLPLTLYQIQTKFRDEPRPRFGIVRSREFIMKDAYSFHRDWDSLNETYQRMYEAYRRIFKRCGLNVLPCEADPGVMGGDVSHEFMAPAESGEDMITVCPCGYAASVAVAACPAPNTATAAAPQPLKEVHTPGKHSVKDVSAFLKVQANQLIKTLIYQVGDQAVGILIRGDHELNETKAVRFFKTDRLKPADPATIAKVTGAPVGFSGPVGLKGIQLIADHAVMSLVNAVAGANKAEYHHTNVNPKRDFTPSAVADLRTLTAEDLCPKCGKSPVKIQRAIEAGHVFKLGTKYSEALKAVFQDEDKSQKPCIMGCYGIGVNRIMATAIEQLLDQEGMRWPVAISPYTALVINLDPSDPTLTKLADQAYEQLTKAGVDTLYDDRPGLSAGAKFKDADLIGIPMRVIVGKKSAATQQVELKIGTSKSADLMTIDQTVGKIKEASQRWCPNSNGEK